MAGVPRASCLPPAAVSAALSRILLASPRCHFYAANRFPHFSSLAFLRLSFVPSASFPVQRKAPLLRSFWRNACQATYMPVRCFATETVTPEAASVAYDADQIQVLQGLDPVRKRPGMYIGSTGSRGLHHLIYEVLDNAIDEAQAGFSTDISVVLFADGSASVTDNGRGIPTDIHPVTKKSALETVLTVLHAGGKFGGDSSGYTVSGGLHGVGVSVVNALSERLEATVWRGGRQYFQAYERGKPACEVTCKELSGSDRSRTGTCVRFWPDKEVFLSTIIFDYNIVAGRIRELAFLNPEVTIKLTQEDDNPERTHTNLYHFAGGLVEYAQWMTSEKKPLHDPIAFKYTKDNLSIDIVLLWCQDMYTEILLGYANSIRTSDGGTHLDGAKAAITRTFNVLGRKLKLIKEKDENLSGEHVREGLTCIVSVKVQNPEFEGQTKTRLGNPEVRKFVDQVVYDYLTEFLELNPGVFEAIISKAIQAAKAATAAKRARELVRQRSTIRSSTLPGKLSDCSCTDPKEAEIFIVEGDSAGGTAKQARDRHYQAILPLRGKILNIERSDEEAIYKSEEIQNLILALGLGLKGEDFRKDQLRYHKIIILTDADVDGAHIRALLLTFFFRYQRSLFEEGCIYVGVPPLYKVERWKKVQYFYDDNELQRALKNFPQGYSIQRFKGLGEMMPLQLWDTTMDPSRRLLKQVTLDDIVEANLTISILMGKKVEARRDLIQNSPVLLNLETANI